MSKRTLHEWGTVDGKDWELYRERGHYFLYVNGEFYCTCETIREFKEELISLSDC